MSDATSNDAGATQGDDASHGTVADVSDPTRLARAIEIAFDYRGDVTIDRRDGAAFEGYIFDRRDEGGRTTIRLMRKDDGSRVTLDCADITRLTFTGRDTAAGKSFETWMRKYVESKLAGREASIHAEPIEE